MNYDFRLPLMAGVDIPIQELQLVLHVPTIKDIAYMGERQFFSAVQYLCLEKEALIQDESLLLDITNFQVLMKILEQTEDKEKKSMIVTLLKLLFPNYSAMINKNSIILVAVDTGDTILIDNNNFDIFQSVIKQALCVDSLFQGNNIIYNPGNDKAKEIMNKIMRGRRRAAEQNGDNNSSVLTRYISILSVARVATLEECIGYNMFQLFDLMDRYIKKTEWDIDHDVKLAGGKTDKQVESWMKDLHPN